MDETGLVPRSDRTEGALISFSIAGPPTGWQRTIPLRSGRTIKTEAQRNFYTLIGWHGRVAMRGRPAFGGAIRLLVEATFVIPASWPAGKKASARAGVLRPTVVPDFDNLAKVVDALKRICWHDDAQVVDCQIRKFYGDNPRTDVEIEVIGAAEDQSGIARHGPGPAKKRIGSGHKTRPRGKTAPKLGIEKKARP